MYRECFKLLRELELDKLDALEISAGHMWRDLGFKTYTEANYPEFDICRDRTARQFDLIIADQVFEHLLRPYRAGKNVYGMLKPGGHFLITTPFLIRIHDVPVDCTRWTEVGMKHFMSPQSAVSRWIRSRPAHGETAAVSRRTSKRGCAAAGFAPCATSRNFRWPSGPWPRNDAVSNRESPLALSLALPHDITSPA